MDQICRPGFLTEVHHLPLGHSVEQVELRELAFVVHHLWELEGDDVMIDRSVELGWVVCVVRKNNDTLTHG